MPSERPRGRPKVTRDGFLYNQKKRVAGNLTSCECERNQQDGCLGRAYIDEFNIVVRYGPHAHNHGPQPERARQCQVSLFSQS